MRSFSLGDRSAASSKAFSAGRVLQAVRGKEHLVRPVELHQLGKAGRVQKVGGKGRVEVHVLFPRQMLGSLLGRVHAAHVGRDDGQPGE